MGALAEQMRLQREAFGIDPPSLRGEELAHYVRWNVLALTNELHELLAELRGWKPWSTAEPEIREPDAYLDEWVDCLHFLMNLALVLDPEEEHLAQLYTRKVAKNRDRQESGTYVGDRAAKRAILLANKLDKLGWCVREDGMFEGGPDAVTVSHLATALAELDL